MRKIWHGDAWDKAPIAATIEALFVLTYFVSFLSYPLFLHIQQTLQELIASFQKGGHPLRFQRFVAKSR